MEADVMIIIVIDIIAYFHKESKHQPVHYRGWLSCLVVGANY